MLSYAATGAFIGLLLCAVTASFAATLHRQARARIDGHSSGISRNADSSFPDVWTAVSLADLRYVYSEIRSTAMFAKEKFQASIDNAGTILTSDMAAMDLLTNMKQVAWNLQELNRKAEDLMRDSRDVVARSYIVGVASEERCKLGSPTNHGVLWQKRAVAPSFLQCTMQNAADIGPAYQKAYEEILQTVGDDPTKFKLCSHIKQLRANFPTDATRLTAPIAQESVKKDLQCLHSHVKVFVDFVDTQANDINIPNPVAVRKLLVRCSIHVEMLYLQAHATFTPLSLLIGNLEKEITKGSPTKKITIAKTKGVKRNIEKLLRMLIGDNSDN